MHFPFPYFGHAYSEAALLNVSVWFETEPLSADRAVITGELGDDVTWSGAVANTSHLRDKSDARDGRIPRAMKSADLKLYGLGEAVPRPLQFSPHLVVDEAIRRLHARFPIAFAVREMGSRDRTTAWHAWALEHRGVAFEQIEALLHRSPKNFVKRGTFDWIAPWLRAATNVARACTTKASLETLDPGEKAAMGDLFLMIAAHAEPKPEWAENRAAYSDVTESRGALKALAEKLSGPRQPVRGAQEVLTQIEKEAQQFAFTRIKLSECPTFEAVKGDDGVRFALAVLATGTQLRFLEKLGGNRPGSTSMIFGPDDQQQLQVRDKLVSQLLRRKGTFDAADAVAMLETLASSIRPLGSWLPIELIAQKLGEHVERDGRSAGFSAALTRLLEAKHALPADETRAWFTRLAQ